MNSIPYDRVEIIIALGLLVLIAFYIILRKRKKGRARLAAEAFRETVLSELKGLYPIPRHIDKDVFDKFRESVPPIKSAANRFKKYIPGTDRKAFETALDEYCTHCRETTWDDCVAYKIAPGERKPEDEGPREIFRQKVNVLLSFTKE